MKYSPRFARTLARTVHLIVALMLGTMVYASNDISEPIRPFLMYVGVPLATLSGLFLWKQALVARVLRLAPQA